jgi:hypothetical protein
LPKSTILPRESIIYVWFDFHVSLFTLWTYAMRLDDLDGYVRQINESGRNHLGMNVLILFAM